MASNLIVGIVRQSYNAVFQPSAFVAAQAETFQHSWLAKGRAISRLAWVYVANLLLYAIPLTLGGVGVDGTQTAPGWFQGLWLPGVSDKTAFWQFLTGLTQNSLFLLALTALVLVTYHVGVTLTLSSDGLVQTMHTVVYSTSAYLAVMFSVTMYVDQNPNTQTAADFLIWVQSQFITFFVDLMNADLTVPGGDSSAVDLATVSPEGELALAVLGLSAIYLLYSMYLGARLNHRTSRSNGAFVVLAVVAAPAIYVVGIILYNLYLL
jgi:hypothetical protein